MMIGRYLSRSSSICGWVNSDSDSDSDERCGLQLSTVKKKKKKKLSLLRQCIKIQCLQFAKKKT